MGRPWASKDERRAKGGSFGERSISGLDVFSVPCIPAFRPLSCAQLYIANQNGTLIGSSSVSYAFWLGSAICNLLGLWLINPLRYRYVWERPVNIELKIYSLLFQGTETGPMVRSQRKKRFILYGKEDEYLSWLERDWHVRKQIRWDHCQGSF